MYRYRKQKKERDVGWQISQGNAMGVILEMLLKMFELLI